VQNYRAQGITAEVLIGFDSEPNEPDAEVLLRRILASYDLNDLLRALSTISLELAEAHDMACDGPDFQLQLARRLAHDKPLGNEVQAALESGNALVSSPESIANLALFAVYNRTCQDVAIPGSLLRVLGLFVTCERRRGPGDNEYYIAPESVEAGFTVLASHVDRFNNVMHRYIEFVRWADEQGGTPGAVDVRDFLQTGTGLSFEDYVRCFVALDVFFDSPDLHVNGIPQLDEARITDAGAPLRRWLSSRAIRAEQIERFLGDQPFVRLRNRGYFQTLSTPLISIAGSGFLVSPRALDNAIGSGIFYAALDASTRAAGLDREARRRAAQHFFAFAGRFFEWYSGRLLKRIAQRSGTYYHAEVVDEHGDLSTDHFILEGEGLVFFEARYGRVARPVIESLSPNGIEEAFANILYAKVVQVDRNIRRFASGELAIPRVQREAIRRLYPVIALPHPFPRSPTIQCKIDHDLKANDWLPPKVGDLEVAPLEVVEAESLEGLDGLETSLSFTALIDEKVSISATRFTYFKNFLTETKNMTLRMHPDDAQKVRATGSGSQSNSRLDTLVLQVCILCHGLDSSWHYQKQSEQAKTLTAETTKS
jgi:hypothetical protein